MWLMTPNSLAQAHACPISGPGPKKRSIRRTVCARHLASGRNATTSRRAASAQHIAATSRRCPPDVTVAPQATPETGRLSCARPIRRSIDFRGHAAASRQRRGFDARLAGPRRFNIRRRRGRRAMRHITEAVAPCTDRRAQFICYVDCPPRPGCFQSLPACARHFTYLMPALRRWWFRARRPRFLI